MTELLRILYVMPTFVTGGTERLVSNLVQRLDPNRFRATVCVFENGLLGQELAERGYAVHCLVGAGEVRAKGLGRLLTLVRRVRTLRRIIAMEGIDVVHTHFLGPCLHAYLAGLSSRRWAWVHTEHARPDVIVAYPRVLLRLARRLVLSADRLTAVSDGVAAYYREHAWAPATRIRVIYNGVTVDLFAAPSDPVATRREIGVPPGAWVIGTVGNLRPEKNHELLLHALARLRGDAPEVWLVVVGGGDRRAALEALAAELGVKERVLFLGARTDVPQLFGVFDAYCLPSHFEGMPLSLLEAMAARRPIAATRVVGIQDLVVDGVTGLLSSPNDPEELSRTLLRLHQDRALGAKLVEAAWQHVDTHGRLETMVRRYGQLYEELIPRTRHG
jgi:glycosyltransferase involved in cell wall biosynthesis